MSLVGPRPLLVEYLPLYSARAGAAPRGAPGLTGLAQVRGRNGLPGPSGSRLDVEYVDPRGPRLDLQVLWETVATVLRRQGISSSTSQTMEPFTASSDDCGAQQPSDSMRPFAGEPRPVRTRPTAPPEILDRGRLGESQAGSSTESSRPARRRGATAS